MNKLIRVFSLFLLMISSIHFSKACMPNVPFFIASNINMFGTEPVSPEDEQFIKDILTRIGVTESVELRKMNDTTIAQAGRESAFVTVDQNDQTYMFISTDWLHELSAKQKLFVIGHESSHILNQDIRKRHWNMHLRRMQEKVADILSAMILQCIDGGISLFQCWANKRGLDTGGYWHPTFRERITYLQDLYIKKPLDALHDTMNNEMALPYMLAQMNTNEVAVAA